VGQVGPGTMGGCSFSQVGYYWGMKVDEYCRKLGGHLDQLPGDERMVFVAGAIAKGFGIEVADVAFFQHDSGQRQLSFIWPVALSRSGSIPSSSRDALVARCVRERRGLIDNRFAQTRHVGIFEQVTLPSAEGLRRLPVQKILSAPIVLGGEVVGAIQVCRKAETLEQAGPDFSIHDQQLLEAIAAEVAERLFGH